VICDRDQGGRPLLMLLQAWSMYSGAPDARQLAIELRPQPSARDASMVPKPIVRSHLSN
jgi:hypothetical protein